jgi:hypothetical protein
MTVTGQIDFFPVSIGSQHFQDVFVRMDGTGVTKFEPNGAGTVNCQYTAGPWETYALERNDDGTFSFRSLTFPNVFLRMDGNGVVAPTPNGGGTVNCQYTAGPWEKFNIAIVETSEAHGNIVTIESNQFSGVYLRLDGTGVTAPNPSGAGTVNCQYTAGPWEKFHLGLNLNAAIDKLGELYPKYDKSLDKYNELIIKNIIEGTTPTDTELVELEGMFDLEPETSTTPPPAPTSCQSAAASLFVDAFVTVIGIMGLRIPGKASIAERLALKVEIDGMHDLKETIENLKTATSNSQKAYQIFKLLGDVYNGNFFQILLSAVSSAITSTWDKIKFAITFVAQLIAWFATEGIALIAQLMLLVTDIAEVVEDAEKVKTSCFASA